MPQDDDDFAFDDQFENLKDDDDDMLLMADPLDALKDIEIVAEAEKKKKGNFAELDMSNNNSEEDDSGLDFDDSTNTYTNRIQFTFAN